MQRRKLKRQLYLSYIFITILALVAVLIFASWAVRGFFFDQIKSGLESRAYLVERQVRELLESTDGDIDAVCDYLGKRSDTRITVILPSGLVVADSERDPSTMDNHRTRPEILTAMEDKAGSSIRYSATLKKEMVYVAIPLKRAGEIKAVIRTSMPLTTLGTALREVHGKILIGGIIIALLAALTSLIVSRKISKPLEDMKKGAERFSRGDFDARLETPDSEEMAGLAEAMNEMAAQLDERIRTILRQRNEQEAILASMMEGVIAVNNEDRIILINQAARDMFGIVRNAARGRLLPKIIPHKEIVELIEKAMEQEGQAEQEIVREDRFLHISAATVRDTMGKAIGAVIVFNDITRIRRLENLRSEFVANVSHELRTPITSIKGFVETLLDGELDARENTERFLNIIHKQADQLNDIIEDLLILSRVEQGAEKQSIAFEEGSVKEVLESSIEVSGLKAAEKDIDIGISCDDGLRTRINPSLLSQAIINLINNAVNFSEPGGVVEVEARQEDSSVVINVRDYGAGIGEEHLPRLFERFYRIDKGRSKKLGGTGLGLAIVKHIAQAHGGSVSVESEPGKGSTFTVFLPYFN